VSRAEVWLPFFAFDTTGDCRKSDCPTNVSDSPTSHLIDRLTSACEILAELLHCVACTNCIEAVYFSGELCELKRVDGISESPGSVR